MLSIPLPNITAGQQLLGDMVPHGGRPDPHSAMTSFFQPSDKLAVIGRQDLVLFWTQTRVEREFLQHRRTNRHVGTIRPYLRRQKCTHLQPVLKDGVRATQRQMLLDPPGWLHLEPGKYGSSEVRSV